MGDHEAAITPAQTAASTAAHQMHEHVKEIKRQMQGLWVELAEALYHFRAGQMWKDIGYSTFESWLSDPEVELERRWVYKLTDAYRYLVIEYEVPLDRVKQLQISKVNEVLPALRRGQVELETALSDVESLNREDLEIQYRGLHSSTPGSPVAATSTVIETDSEPEWATCPTCGSTYRRRPS
jgi:ribosomal protein L20